MVRAPAGWHLSAGSVPAVGGASYRQPATSQRAYWRHTTAQLHAGASALQPQLIVNVPAFPFAAAARPQGTGERWLVDQVQVYAGTQYQQPPLVVQQLAAQTAGSVATPPPPIIAQVWLCSAGPPLTGPVPSTIPLVLIPQVSLPKHLLAQTSQGGDDNIALGGQPVEAGEQITVVWYGLASIPLTLPPNAWFKLTGTRLVLDT